MFDLSVIIIIDHFHRLIAFVIFILFIYQLSWSLIMVILK